MLIIMQIKPSKLSRNRGRADKRLSGTKSERIKKGQHTAGQPILDGYTKAKQVDSKPSGKSLVKNKYMCYSIHLHEFLKKNGLKTIGEVRHSKTGRTAFIYNKDEKLNCLLNTWSANRVEPDASEPIEKWIIKDDKKGKSEDNKVHSIKTNKKNKGNY